MGTRAHSSEAAFPSVTHPYNSRCTAASFEADAVHLSPSGRAPSAANAYDVCPRKRGAAFAAPLKSRRLVPQPVTVAQIT